MMMQRKIEGARSVRVYAALVVAVSAATLGCLPEGEGGFSSVTGHVHNQDFSMISGVAEQMGDGFFITLTDASGFDCTSTPSGNYLKVVMTADGEGSFGAGGNVTFGSVEDNVEDSEAASSGSVTIASVDEFEGVISGSVSATGASSDVSGDFTVDICD